jgi:hypothetical protein
MNYERFKTLLATSKIRIAVIGGVIALAGAAMLLSLFMMHESKVAYWIVTGIVVVTGFPMLILSLRDLSRIKSGTWPLLKAISEEQRDYIVWVYNNEIISQVGGTAVGKSSNIVLYNRHGKLIQVVLGKKASASANDVISYLASEFPSAFVGYSDQTKAAVAKLLGKKI